MGAVAPAMRALIPLIVLGTLLILAGEWRSRTTAGTSPARSPAERSSAGVTSDGWSLLVLGRPSGAAPLRRPEPGPVVTPLDVVPPPGPPPAPVAPDTRYTVRPNDTLGVICQKHYDVRPLSSVIEAVAAYNDLSSVDSIRSGDVLLLPDAAVLFGRR